MESDVERNDLFGSEDEEDVGTNNVNGSARATGELSTDEAKNDPAANVSKAVLDKIKALGEKKKPKRAFPKLDADRITGPLGILSLMSYFDSCQFKGKGYEAGDLSLLMSAMERWAHRLFPKLSFDDVLERCERLGTKRPVQTAVHKLRMGLTDASDADQLAHLFADSHPPPDAQQGSLNLLNQASDRSPLTNDRDIDALLNDVIASDSQSQNIPVQYDAAADDYFGES